MLISPSAGTKNACGIASQMSDRALRYGLLCDACGTNSQFNYELWKIIASALFFTLNIPVNVISFYFIFCPFYYFFLLFFLLFLFIISFYYFFLLFLFIISFYNILCYLTRCNWKLIKSYSCRMA